MATATIHGHEIHYVQRGDGEPLLLIQGMSGNHLHWGEPFMEELARDVAVTAYDHRGIGRSGRVEEPFTLVDLAEDAVALLDALGLESAHVLGISMGGMIAQEVALALLREYAPARPVRLLGVRVASLDHGERAATTDPQLALPL